MKILIAFGFMIFLASSTSFGKISDLKHFDKKMRAGNDTISDGLIDWLTDSIGFWVDPAEYEILKNLLMDIQKGNLRAENGILAILRAKVGEGPNGEKVTGLSRAELEAIESETGPCEEMRKLRTYEVNVLQKVFGSSLDFSRIRIVSDGYDQPYHTTNDDDPKLSEIHISCRSTYSDMPWMYVHEATHAWQYQHDWPIAGKGGSYDDQRLAVKIQSGISLWDLLSEEQSTLFHHAWKLEYFNGAAVSEPWKSYLDKWVPIIRAMPPR